MSDLTTVIISILAYIGAVRFALSRPQPKWRSALFAVFNIAFFCWLSLLATVTFDEYHNVPIVELGREAVIRQLGLIAGYVTAVAAGYFLMRGLAKREGWLPWAAFFYPISLLVAFRFVIPASESSLQARGWHDWVIPAAVIGLSYMAFRLSYLVLEVRNGFVRMPSLSEYLGFAFFLPTIVIGPINPFGFHQRSMDTVNERPVQIGTSLLRIVVGAAKFMFLAHLANQLSYNGLFLDGKPHGLFDLGIAIIFYYLYLYLNFSGFCDMAIGVASLAGIRVKENFNNPFLARNIKEFWNRWHITLSEYTRDVVFGPVSKGLIRKLGPKYTNVSISVGIVAVFLVIGIWHGFAVHYIVFGLAHAAGMIINHYYTIRMKRYLGKQRYKAYDENPIVNGVAMVMTFLYVAGAFALFANSYESLGTIYKSLVFEF